MARVSVEVNRVLLMQSLALAEKAGPLKNRGILWQETAKIYNQKTKEAQITHSVVMLRVKEWNLTVKTPIGKRGRSEMTEEQKKAMLEGRKGKKGGRAKKMAIHAPIFEKLRKVTPVRFLPLLEMAEKGSLRAATKLNCLHCSNWQTSEVKHCHVRNCFLYPQRPYQNIKDEDLANAPVVEPMEVEEEEAA